MEASPKPNLRVIDGQGEVQDLCPDCLVKDREKTRMAKSYETTLRNQREEIERLQDDRDAEFPHDEPAENVMARWHELAMASGWFTGSPSCGPTSTRWRDTKRALHGVKTKDGTWNWPPRSEEDLLAATEGVFARSDPRRDDPSTRVYLDPCTAFFANFDRNFEAATNPPPQRFAPVERADRQSALRPVELSPFDRAVRVLWREYGEDRVSCVWNSEKGCADSYMVPCPIHPDNPEFLVTGVVRRGDGRGAAPRFACVDGCSPSDMAGAVRELERRQEVRRLEAVSRATAVGGL